MGNCCRSPAAVAREDVKSSFSNADHHGKRGSGAEAVKQKAPITVLYRLHYILRLQKGELRWLFCWYSVNGIYVNEGALIKCLVTGCRLGLVHQDYCLTMGGDCPGVMGGYENGDWLELWQVILGHCVNQCLRELVIADCICVVIGVNFGNARVAGPWDFLCSYVWQCVVSDMFCLDLAFERGPHHPASSISLFFQTEDPFPNAYLLGFVKTLWCHIVSEYLLGCFANGERFSEIVGSPYYMAPEVLKRNYGPEIDIWSAGVILYILLCGVPPFWAESEQGVAQAILRGLIDFKREPWPSISEGAKSLVRQMLEPDPKLRLTAKQVLEHPWLQNAKKAPNVPLGDVVKSRLKQFSMMNRFKRKALRVIADFLSNEEVEDIKDMFKKMDNDNDGIVSIEELKAGFRNFGSQLAESEIQLLIEAVDSNGKGTLDYGEFVAVSLHLKRMANDEHLRKAFSYFDKDGNGYIEPDELRNALMEDGADDCTDVANDIFLEVDTDKDGRISYDEFVAMMKTGTDWRKASRHYSRGRFNSLSLKLMKDGSLNLGNE
ncbi:hypothetical protein ACSQ67_016329 [Phaseolus vulgaris]